MKKRTKLIVLLFIILLLGTVYFFVKNKVSIKTEPKIETRNTQKNYIIPTLSLDKKSITADGEIMLSIDDETIFNFFKNANSGLCDASNINNTLTRKSFCTDKSVFKSKANFSKIILSSSGNAIGFVVITDELTPDSMMGIFFPKNNTYKVHIITGYYLGNDFMSFSPSGNYFVYKEGCFEGICGLTVKKTNTLEDIIHLGNPETEPNHTFIRWLSDNEIEYRVGDETKTSTF